MGQSIKIEIWDGDMTKEYMQERIDLYSDMLYKIAYLQLKNSEDAKDIVQEVFYQYIKRQEEFDSEEHEKAWFIKVTLNGCRKLWRSAWFRHTEGLPKQEAASENNLEKEILEREKKKRLLEEIWRLPRKYREVIHLFYFEEMSVKEIGEVTGRNPSTVTSQLTRGRELLKKRLKEEYRYE